MKSILLNIAMVTYNQEKYIAQAIESVLMQQTTFNYQLIIGDDCSKDSTGEICRAYEKKYSDKILLITNKINLGLVLNYKKIFNLCAAQYIAILEGDDYWTDPFKLQKQVDIFKSDHKIGIVHTDNDRLYENNQIIYSYKKKNRVIPKNGYVFKHLIKKNYISSITACFRKDLFDRYVDYDVFIEKKLVTIDYSIWMEISFHSKVYYINESTAVYRVLKSSITNNKNFCKKEIYFNRGRNIKKYFVKKYSPPNYNVSKVDGVYDLGLFKWALKLEEQKKAIEYFYKAKKIEKEIILLAPFVNYKPLFRILVFISKRLSRQNFE